MSNETQTAEPIQVVGPSPTIHPLIFERQRDLMMASPLGERAFGATIAGLNHANSVLNEVSEAQKAILAEETKRGGNIRKSMDGFTGDVAMINGKPRVMSHRYNEFADAAEGALDVAISEIEKQKKAVIDTTLQFNRELERSLHHSETAKSPDMQVQIRDRLAQMTSTKAKTFIMQRIRQGDAATIHAVFHSPAWLSGLKDDDIGKLRPIAYRALSPHMFDQMNTSDRMWDTLDTAHKHLTKTKQSVAGFRSAAAKKASDALTSLRKIKT